MEKKMFCFQCQETANNKGCTIQGVCGKKATTANLQDALVDATKGLANIYDLLHKQNIDIVKEDRHIIAFNLFITITNANFDDHAIETQIQKTVELKQKYLPLVENKELLSQEATKSLETLENELNYEYTLTDERSLKELILYGLKGMAAYLKHAYVLDYVDENIDYAMIEILSQLTKSLSLEEAIELTDYTGKIGVQAMALLDKANTETYGNPEITKVNIGVRNNPGILISGHDLKDLEELLIQSENSGVDIYTHGEMLPAHYYPKFKKYAHFVGNYGNAWWKQKEEFEAFNGPILLTTNCLIPPKPSYKDRVYTTGAVGFEGCPYIEEVNGHKDFTKLIEHAKRCQAPKELESGEIVGGFAHEQVFALADKVVDAVKTGAISKFVVMGGCDGHQKGRSYYTDFAKALPQDTVILTAGCAKYRYNKLDLGDIQGIPRVLDAGQCNDSYSLAVIALKLKEIFNVEDVNELPIIYNIAWYEQKAVIVLLALLHLGIKNIHLGPTLPAFLSENVANFLVKTFGIAPITNVEQDMELFFK